MHWAPQKQISLPPLLKEAPTEVCKHRHRKRHPWRYCGPKGAHSIEQGCLISGLILYYSVGRFLKLLLSRIACPSPVCCSIRARTLRGSPNSVMKPWASLWLYSSPVVNEAMLSLYRLYLDQEPAPRIEPLYSFSCTQPVQVFCVTSTNALHASISGVNHLPS